MSFVLARKAALETRRSGVTSLYLDLIFRIAVMGAIDSIDVTRLLARFRQFWNLDAALIESASATTEKFTSILALNGMIV
ncbi:MAG TPA: hypothetical protein VJ810_39215 [Blastocatellia bacterium]|nr:hypothetical protein [Blastocatellia bacterium]